MIENIFLAAAAEGLACSMRIPLNQEHDVVKAKLKVPPTYMIPVFIGIGYADPEEHTMEQYHPDLRIHLKEDARKGILQSSPELLAAIFTGVLVQAACWWI